MNLYDCKVRLADAAGLTLTEVVKTGVTAPEVILLRHIHGDERVVGLTTAGLAKDFNANEEISRLALEYPKLIDHAGKQMPLVQVLFEGRDLPNAVSGAQLPGTPQVQTPKPETAPAPVAAVAETKPRNMFSEDFA